jgi:hypothetical protein
MLHRTWPGLRYDAGLIGSGSEVLGYDTERSTDHDFGPRVLLFLASDEPLRDNVVELLDAALPGAFRGHPTRFIRGVETPDVRKPPHQVVVTDVASWTMGVFDTDMTRPLPPSAWLGVSWQRLTAATRGAVFHRGLGELDAMRDRLAFYPDDIWRYVLAAQWRRIGQEEHFVGRTGEVGDELGSAVLAGRLVRDAMHLTMLLRRQYPPYIKWLGSAFAELPDAETLGPLFAGALRAADWRSREKLLCQAYEHLAALHNDTGLGEPQDPSCRGFYDRPFRVIGADRFSTALLASISDPSVRALPVIGCVDQFTDSTDVLSHAGRSMALARALFAGSEA